MSNKDNTLNQLKDELLELAKIWWKIKFTDKTGFTVCCTCLILKYWRDLQGWHFRPCSNWLATKFELDNINAQCAWCNWRSNQGEQYLHWHYIDKVYWFGRAEQLTKQAHTTKKRRMHELEDALTVVVHLIAWRYHKQTPQQQALLIEFMEMNSRKKDCKKALEALRK